MATNTLNIRHLLGGGWATDFGPTTDVVPDASNQLLIPYLIDAYNVLFELDGGPHKIGGTSRINSSALESGAAIKGAYDYWRMGVAGSSSRRRVVHVGTKVLADNNDGNFSVTLFTGLTSGAVPNYNTFDDFLIIASDAIADVPKSWDQTTAQNLAGTPPRFSFSVTHRNRAWAAGNFSSPSTLYYSANVNPEDWIGAGSGSIAISPDDGDMITAIWPYKQDLIVFKGPNKGSIWRITGSSPSDFSGPIPVARGIGACWQSSVFEFGDDLGFMSFAGTVHSLKDTAAYGTLDARSLSLPINTWIRDHLNFNRLRHIWAACDVSMGIVFFALPIDGGGTNTVLLAMDHRFNPVRWSLIGAYSGECVISMKGSGNRDSVVLGGSDGYLRTAMTSQRSKDSISAYQARVTTPFLNYGDPMLMKTLSAAAVGIEPAGDYTVSFGWTRDNNTQQTYSVEQGGSSLLGSFILGTDTLGGAMFTDRYMELEEGGEFRSIQYQVTQEGLNEDLELHSITASIKGGALSTEN